MILSFGYVSDIFLNVHNNNNYNNTIFLLFLQTTSTYDSFHTSLGFVDDLQSKFILGEGEWYSEGINWIFINNYYDELIEKIQTACENTNIECQLR